MAHVIDNLVASVRMHPRKIVIIYNNPTCHDIVIRSDMFHRVTEYPDEWGNGISIYTNDYSGAPRQWVSSANSIKPSNIAK